MSDSDGLSYNELEDANQALLIEAMQSNVLAQRHLQQANMLIRLVGDIATLMVEANTDSHDDCKQSIHAAIVMIDEALGTSDAGTNDNIPNCVPF